MNEIELQTLEHIIQHSIDMPWVVRLQIFKLIDEARKVLVPLEE